MDPRWGIRDSAPMPMTMTPLLPLQRGAHQSARNVNTPAARRSMVAASACLASAAAAAVAAAMGLPGGASTLAM